MKRVISPMIFLFFIPLFAPAQASDKWEYTEITINSAMKSFYVDVSKSDTGVLKSVFFDEATGKPKKFARQADVFNALGNEGFELIIWGPRHTLFGSEEVYTFKRPKKS